MVVLQVQGFVPLLAGSGVVFASALLLGVVMQNWDVALLRPSQGVSSNALLADTATAAYTVVGFLHFGGMVGGFCTAAGTLLSIPFDPVTGQSIRIFLCAVVFPVALVVTFVVWLFWVLPALNTWKEGLWNADGMWVAWFAAHAVLFAVAAGRVVHDVYNT